MQNNQAVSRKIPFCSLCIHMLNSQGLFSSSDLLLIAQFLFSEYDFVPTGVDSHRFISSISFLWHPHQSMLMIYMSAFNFFTFHHSLLLINSWPSQQNILIHAQIFSIECLFCHILLKD